MPRVVKDAEYAARRNQILDTAQRLIYVKGYEQMTIQDILDELHISKGAFYHYFDGKPALLDALLDRLMAQAKTIIGGIVADAGLSALEKFDRCFSALAQWKTSQRSYVLALLRGWYADDNAIVRQKAYSRMMSDIPPLFARVIAQGVAERAFACPEPNAIGGVVLTMMQRLGEMLAEQMIDAGPDDLGRLNVTVAAYTGAIERVLGAPPGSIKLFPPEALSRFMNGA